MHTQIICRQCHMKLQQYQAILQDIRLGVKRLAVAFNQSQLWKVPLSHSEVQVTEYTD